jgi:hypothetical protein
MQGSKIGATILGSMRPRSIQPSARFRRVATCLTALCVLAACSGHGFVLQPSAPAASGRTANPSATVTKSCTTVNGAQLCVYHSKPMQPTGYGVIAGGNMIFGNDAQYFGDSPIDVITPAGTISHLPPLPGFGIGFIENVVIGSDGRIWFAPNILNRYYPPSLPTLWAESTTGTNVAKINLGAAITNANQIAAGPDGAIWVTCSLPTKAGKTQRGCIERVTTAGVVSMLALPATYNPGVPIVSAYGKIWFSNNVTTAQQLGRITMPQKLGSAALGKDSKGFPWSPQVFTVAGSTLWTIVADISYASKSPDGVADEVCQITSASALAACHPIPVFGIPRGPMGLAIAATGVAWVAVSGTQQADAAHPAVMSVAKNGTVKKYALAGPQFPSGLLVNAKSVWFTLPLQYGFGQLTP